MESSLSWRPGPRRQDPPFPLGSSGASEPLWRAYCIHTSSTHQAGFPTCKAMASGAEQGAGLELGPPSSALSPTPTLLQSLCRLTLC